MAKIGQRFPFRVVGPVLIVAVSMCAGLLLMELVTRVMFPAFDPSDRFEFDHRLGILSLGKPDAVRRQIKNTGDYDVSVSINRHGLRDEKNISGAKPSDLVVVGDSFAWGWGVESKNRFSDRLQEITGQQTFNLATPTDIAGYAALLKYGKSLGAKIGQVILTVCMENDIRVYGKDKIASALAPPPSFRWKHWLTLNSALYVMVTTVVHQTPWLSALGARYGVLIPNLEGVSKNSFDPDAIESSAEKLEALSQHHRILVVIIPSRNLWAGMTRKTEDAIHRTFVASLQKRRVRLLDLRPAFEKGGAALSYHFAHDGHWNSRGHALASQEIAKCLGDEACR